MPIIGLTDQGARLPLLGKIRKGAEKTSANKPGADLNSFRITSDNPDILKSFEESHSHLGGLLPRKIGVILPYPTVDQNLEAWMEEWSGNSLIRRCDGQEQSLYLQGNKYSQKPIPCLGCDKNGCKTTGRLRVLIPSLRDYVGFFELETHSKWDVKHIAESLTAIEAMVGTLQGIPLVLSRVEREISTPGFKEGDSRRRVKKSLISLSIHKTLSQPIMTAFETAALLRIKGYQPAAGAIAPTDDLQKKITPSDWQQVAAMTVMENQ
jgi:hypothetical protein